MSRMKILQLCKKFPFPVRDGESIAVTNLSKALNQLNCEVTLLAMNTKKHFFDLPSLPESFNHYKDINVVPIDNRIKVKDAFANLWSKDSYHIARFVSKPFEEKLIELLKQEKFDIVQLETLYLAPYIPTIRKYSKAKVAMRAHNVEHEIWQRVMENTKFFPKRWYLNYLLKKLTNFETEQLNAYDLLVPITKRDEGIFENLGYKGRSVVTPIGIETQDYKVNDQSFNKDISLSFIGSLDWMPNQGGLVWFLDNIWQSLLQQHPHLQLHVAGRNTPQWLMDKQWKNVTFHGEIPHAGEFISQHSVMIVPLLAGSGMRAKILEGMALGKVVLSTSLGLEGIPAKDREEVLVANTADEFIKAIQYCYTSNGQLINIGQKAREFVGQHYDNHHIAQKLLDTYQAIAVTPRQDQSTTKPSDSRIGKDVFSQKNIR